MAVQFFRLFLVLLVAAGVFLLTFASEIEEPKARLTVETGPVSPEFARLPGSLTVRFTSRHVKWSGPRDLQFTGGGVKWLDLRGLRDNNQSNTYPDFRKSFPKEIADYRLDWGKLWAESPDKKYVALAAKSASSSDRDNSLVILDIKREALIADIDGDGAWQIASLDWSPDGKYIAFIRSDWRARGMFGKIADFVRDRPRDYNRTHRLVVVDRTGAVVAKTRLTEEYNVDARLAWER